jgi:hypothetical protein
MAAAVCFFTFLFVFLLFFSAQDDFFTFQLSRRHLVSFYAHLSVDSQGEVFWQFFFFLLSYLKFMPNYCFRIIHHGQRLMRDCQSVLGVAVCDVMSGGQVVID